MFKRGIIQIRSAGADLQRLKVKADVGHSVLIYLWSAKSGTKQYYQFYINYQTGNFSSSTCDLPPRAVPLN